MIRLHPKNRGNDLKRTKSDNKTCWKIWSLNEQTDLLCFEKLNDSNSKTILKACKPYFSNKNSNMQENIKVFENNKLLTNQIDKVSTFNIHFWSFIDSIMPFYLAWTYFNIIREWRKRSIFLKEALKQRYFPNNLECAMLYNNRTLLIKWIIEQWVYYQFYKLFFGASDVRASVNFFNFLFN